MKKSTKHLFSTLLYFLGLSIALVLLYWVLTIPHAKADTAKVGVGNFVMAVSYTDSYDDLQYVANFMNCELATEYYNQNCTAATIMMCQAEDRLYMPINHDSHSSYDINPTIENTCGFISMDSKFTGVK